MLFSIVLISSSGPAYDDGDGGTDRRSSVVRLTASKHMRLVTADWATHPQDMT